MKNSQLRGENMVKTYNTAQGLGGKPEMIFRKLGYSKIVVYTANAQDSNCAQEKN